VKAGDLVSTGGSDAGMTFGVILEIWIDVSPSRRVNECDDNDHSAWIECLWEDGIDGISADEVMVVNEAR